LIKNPEFCQKCGAGLDPGVNFCHRCGEPVQDRQGTGSPPVGDVAPQCPNCGQSDRLTPVVSIFQRENISVDNYGVWANNTCVKDGDEEGDDASEPKAPQSLAEKLAPPEEPEYTSAVIKWMILPFIPVLNFIGMWFAPMSWKTRVALVTNGVLVMILTFISTRVESQLRASGNAFYAAVEELNHAGPFTILDAPYILGLILLVIYYTGVIRENIRRKKHFYSVLIPAYQKAMVRWRGLNYCARCNGVITAEPFSGVPDFVSADRMNTLLYGKKVIIISRSEVSSGGV